MVGKFLESYPEIILHPSLAPSAPDTALKIPLQIPFMYFPSATHTP